MTMIVKCGENRKEKHTTDSDLTDISLILSDIKMNRSHT